MNLISDLVDVDLLDAVSAESEGLAVGSAYVQRKSLVARVVRARRRQGSVYSACVVVLEAGLGGTELDLATSIRGKVAAHVVSRKSNQLGVGVFSSEARHFSEGVCLLGWREIVHSKAFYFLK